MMRLKTQKADQIENLKSFIKLDTNHYTEEDMQDSNAIGGVVGFK